MFQKGNTEASKHNAGGRKTKAEEVKDAVEMAVKKTIEELATDKVYGCLETIKKEEVKDVKDIALPVYLKSKADKQIVENKISLVEFINGKDSNNSDTDRV